MVLAVQLRDVAITLTVFIFLFTIPSIRFLAKGNWRVKSPNLDQSLYEDEDGVASLESTAQFSNKIQFITAFALITIGIALSIADAIVTTINEKPRTASADSHLVPIFLLIPAWVSSHSSKMRVSSRVDWWNLVLPAITAHWDFSAESACEEVQFCSL